MMDLRISGALCVLLGVFLLGMWLTWRGSPDNPSGLPTGQKFVAVSLNGQPVGSSRYDAKLPTFEIKHRSFFNYGVSGTGHCNYWGGDISLLPRRKIVWGRIVETAVGCSERKAEERYLRTLLQTTRWRTQDGSLILENGTDVLRFLRATK
ncbi:MAG: META domain-containing protein [Candidatus Binataceae bacterium]